LRYQRNLDAEEAVREILGLLELLELSPFAAAWPASVSRDWLKRAALARALVLRPRLLLCDHPLSGLGTRHRQWWLRFLDQLWHGHDYFGGTPMTVVVTTAELAPWQHADRRFSLLRDGQFLPLGAWTEVIQAVDPAVSELLAQPPQATL
jgi:energy-coupling factor transporter ATP-binding protein EcfA2